jgi:hypothetical protein
MHLLPGPGNVRDQLVYRPQSVDTFRARQLPVKRNISDDRRTRTLNNFQISGNNPEVLQDEDNIRLQSWKKNAEFVEAVVVIRIAALMPDPISCGLRAKAVEANLVDVKTVAKAAQDAAHDARATASILGMPDREYTFHVAATRIAG